MRWIYGTLVLLLFCAARPALTFAADAKWIHATSEHFDLYTDEGDGEAKAALQHLEIVRLYFLGATHAKDPGGQNARIVAFHSGGDYSKYKPQEIGSGKAYAQLGAAPATIAVIGLKPEIYPQVFREYAQLVFDESSASVPYWMRAGLADLYSTLKPGDNLIKLGIPPVREYRSTGIGDLDLSMMFGLDRTTLLAARNKQGSNFYAEGANAAVLGAAAAAQTTALQQSQNAMAQDYQGGIWMVTHMVMFHQEYRPKFGEFVGTLGRGQTTAAAFRDVYGRSIGDVLSDLRLYAKLPSLSSASVPFKYEKPAAAKIQPVTKEDQYRIFADLAKSK